VVRKIILTARADEEIDEACDWYACREPGLDERFLRTPGQTFDLIATQPELHPVRFTNVRRATLKKFPFAVYFRIDEELIIVHSVFHEGRNPANLKDF
jgi:plasmid stabilization system protein ParE